MNKPVFLTSLTLLTILILSVLYLPSFGSFEKKVSNYYIKNTLKDTEASNSVSAIVWDYRAYDTLGEETVLFTATLGIYAIFRKYKKRIRKRPIRIFS